MMSDNLVKAAVNASNTIHSIYQWIDMIDEAGGTTSIAGIAKCQAFMTSMKNNKSRIDKSVMEPLEKELELYDV